MEKLVAVLICLPFLMALLPAVIKNDKVRGITVYLCGAIVGVLAIVTAGVWYASGGKTMTFDLPYTEVFNKIISDVESKTDSKLRSN